MADKTMLNFRCPAELLDAIDAIGQKRYPSDTAKHGCDRTKTLLDIVRAGIEALSDGSVVLQQSDNIVRQRKIEDAVDIEARFAAIEERLAKIEGLSETPSESLRPDSEEVDKLRSSLEKADTIISLRNQEIVALNSRLAVKDETITELDEQIDRLEELQAELSDLKQKSVSASDSSNKVIKIFSLIKTLLPAKAKLPSNTMTKIEEILEGQQ